MESFLKFLQQAKNGLNNLELYTTIHLVLGNESCDLDSTISALSLAYLIHSQNSPQDPHYLTVPIMNVEAKFFSLRTETQYLLQKYGIHLDCLVFKDQINYSNVLRTRKVKTSLVDHHVLSSTDQILEETVLHIFDHRPINNLEICKSNREKTVIKIVGSCSTLIAQEIINSQLPILFNELCYLLYATIIYDTIGLDKESGKTFEDDLTVAQHLESILKPTETRRESFNLLWKIHNDTSNLTTKDLLYRDLKVVKGIPIPGLPLLVEDYLKREDADAAITSFASEYNSLNVVLIGIDASKGVRRDIALFSKDTNFRENFIKALKNSNEIAGSDLRLTEIDTKCNDVVCFRQGNIKLTRKFILPLVNKAAQECIQNNSS